MDDIRLEHWVIEVLDRVERGEPNEDSRVELKSDWPSADQAARRIAGHANASRGDSILWIVGADEKFGVVGAPAAEISSWFSQVRSCFDGIVPTLHDLVISYSGQTVVALLFDTGRAPFVTRNPKYGEEGGGPVSLEVPWREATSVRSARREDLIRLLVPLQAIPGIEVLAGGIRIDMPNDIRSPRVFSATLSIYVVPQSDRRIVVPLHKLRSSFCFEGEDEPREPRYVRFEAARGSTTLDASTSELVVRGPGQCDLIFPFSLRSLPDSCPNSASAEVHIGFAGMDRFAVVLCQFEGEGKDRLQLSGHQILIPG